MTSSKRFTIIGVIVSILLLLFLSIKIPTIQVSYMDGSFYLKEDTFEIGWTHSVEKEPWFETFIRKGDALYLVETKFKTFGAGTPSTGEVIPSDDGFVHMKLDEKLTELNLTVSGNVKTTLYTGTSEVKLYQRVDDYEVVVIEVVKIPLWRLLRGENR